MKKEIIIIIVIVLLVVISDTIFTSMTDKRVEDIISRLEEIKEEKNLKNRIDKAEELKSTWKAYFVELEFYIEHNDLEKISIEIEDLYCYCKSDNEEEWENSIARLKSMSEHIKDKHRLKLNNFF